MQTTLKRTHASEPHTPITEIWETSWNLTPVTMAEWLDIWAPIHACELLHPRNKDGTSLVEISVSDDVMGLRFAAGCQMFRHSDAQASNAGDVIAVHRIHEGYAAMEHPECKFVHRPGAVVISDLRDAFRGAHLHAIGECLFLPRAVLGLTNAEPFSPIMRSLSSVQGRQIAGEIERFFAMSSGGLAYDRTHLSGIILSLVRESWSPVSDREEWWRGRRKLIHKYIETHLEDPNLGPFQICELFNMSRATLYRMFEQDGGVRRFIQDRRLHSAMWDLATEGVKRGRLSQVAERWGFSSDANFNRAVKLAYGMPPGALFKKQVKIDPERSGAPNPSETKYAAMIANWFRTHSHEPAVSPAAFD